MGEREYRSQEKPQDHLLECVVMAPCLKFSLVSCCPLKPLCLAWFATSLKLIIQGMLHRKTPGVVSAFPCPLVICSRHHEVQFNQDLV